MKSVFRFVRLLPMVIVVGAAVLALKGEGLVKSAWAQSASASDNEVAALAADTAPLAKDTVDEDPASASAAEVDVLSSLAKRREQLDARARDLDMRANLLAAAETRVEGKIQTLKELQDKITALLGQRDSEQEDQIKSLVKTYSTMKAKDAARIFNTLDDGVLIPVAQEMKSDALAPILAAMNPDAAQKLTLKLANRLQLPATAAPALAPEPDVAPPAAAAPGTAAANPPPANPPPAQPPAASGK